MKEKFKKSTKITQNQTIDFLLLKKNHKDTLSIHLLQHHFGCNNCCC